MTETDHPNYVYDIERDDRYGSRFGSRTTRHEAIGVIAIFERRGDGPFRVVPRKTLR